MFQRNFADPYIIAEIGMNYEGSLDRAKRMIDEIARAGGHAAKFQTYKADTLASPEHSPAYWDLSEEQTTSQHELFKRFDSFGKEEYTALAAHCESRGIDFLSTPFDLESVDLLAPLMPAIKVASADLTNVPLLRKVAAQKKPVILSTGASTHEEINVALGILEVAGANEIALLHCVLRYPTPPALANISGLRELERAFGTRATIGYSDHVAPDRSGATPALELAVAFGARIVEKHFTDDRLAHGNDHYHAFDSSGLEDFVQKIACYRELAGSGIPDIDSQSSAVENARRRIFTRVPLEAGTKLHEEDLIALRANIGMEIGEWDNVIGRVLSEDIQAAQPLERKFLK